MFISSIRVDPGPTYRGPTSLLALKIRTPVANMGKLRSIGQMPVYFTPCEEYSVKHLKKKKYLEINLRLKISLVEF